MPKYGVPRFAGVFDRPHHSGDAAFAKTARHENRVKILQLVLVVVLHQIFGFDPVDVDAQIVRDAGVRQGFAKRFVRVFELDIFADDRDRTVPPLGSLIVETSSRHRLEIGVSETVRSDAGC